MCNYCETNRMGEEEKPETYIFKNQPVKIQQEKITYRKENRFLTWELTRKRLIR